MKPFSFSELRRTPQRPPRDRVSVRRVRRVGQAGETTWKTWSSPRGEPGARFAHAAQEAHRNHKGLQPYPQFRWLDPQSHPNHRTSGGSWSPRVGCFDSLPEKAESVMCVCVCMCVCVKPCFEGFLHAGGTERLLDATQCPTKLCLQRREARTGTMDVYLQFENC